MSTDQLTQLAFDSALKSNEQIVARARKIIKDRAKTEGAYCASIDRLYRAFGKGDVSGFSIPAFNIRTLTYDTSYLIFSLMKELSIGACIFEIARGEVTYTGQSHEEYACSILAGAVDAGWRGPVFLQADHTQFNRTLYEQDASKQRETLKLLINTAIEAGFFNIDIDASTLVQLERATTSEQQEWNALETAHLYTYIREQEQKSGTMVSVGGEIGHIGGKNSTVEDFQAFMQEFIRLTGATSDTGLSKISVQTGTSHGGTMLPDGSMQEAKIDFNVLKEIGKAAREQYGMGGAVQHGASTVSITQFNRFPPVGTVEVHLATGIQNTVFDTIPELKQEIEEWVITNRGTHKAAEETDRQFIYKQRKWANGPLKSRIWNSDSAHKQVILSALNKQITDIFTQLNLIGSRTIVERYYSF